MLRSSILLICLLQFLNAPAQRLLPAEEAVQLALNNQRNLSSADLAVQQQQQLLKTASSFDNPQLFVEATPYEPMIVGVQQSFRLPGVYRNRKALQKDRIRLAQLQMQGTAIELKREVYLNYLQLQFLSASEKLLSYQDSIYQEIRKSSIRFFEAGQINKLEELQAISQADAVRNQWERIQTDFAGEWEVFRFYTNTTDSFMLPAFGALEFVQSTDTLVNIRQQLLQQQVALSEKELRVEKAELLPQLQAGLSFPTKNNYERIPGYQAGISLPLWGRQNRARINAAKTGIEMARAQQQLEQQRLNAQYKQAFYNYYREVQSLEYFNATALPQARAIMETSQRLFSGGELNYIESLRNLQSAFDIFFNHVETIRALNEAVIQLRYLNGSL